MSDFYSFLSNLIFLTDSYKVSHWRQYPKSITKMLSYFSSRGGLYPETVANVLLHYQMKRLEGVQITQEKIEEAAELFKFHFGDESIFNRAGWEYILKEHGGRLPLKIKAVAEGTVVPHGNVLIVAESTDPKCPWVTNYFETFMVQNWYPSTVATFSYTAKNLINRYLEETGDPAGLPYKLHDFGVRGTSSMESAAIGGAAHLLNFSGTDNLPAMALLKKFYGGYVGNSIPAAEHSTACSWIKEKDFFRHMIEEFPGMVAVVSDTYDIYEACRVWSTELKDQVLARKDGCVVIRPDSGDPLEVLEKIFEILGENFKNEIVVNKKGYRVLPPQVRVIQGDGVDIEAIGDILEMLKLKGWSADNIAFGCGGALLQKLNRDTNKFAFKASAVLDNGVWREIRKNPVTDPGKASKAGLLDLVKIDGTFTTTSPSGNSLLAVVFENGMVPPSDSLETIRTRLVV